MISVIICSANKEMLAKVTVNIEATIGVAYQLIAIDNSIKKEGICRVYNEGAAKANFEIICFVHEDILIHTPNWGQGLVNLLANETIGLAGVSGATYKSGYAATWPACHPSLYRANTLQHFKNEPVPVSTFINPYNKKFEEVAVLDGVFLAGTKNIFALYPFDEKSFAGFHCYDLDISLHIGNHYKVVVWYGILIEHFSEGQLNTKWFCDSIQLHKKWKKILPKKMGEIDKLLIQESDFIACKSFLQHALNFYASKKILLKYYFKLVFFYWKFNHFAFSKSVLKKIVKF